MQRKSLLVGSIALFAASASFAENGSRPWFERSEFLHVAASAELATNGYTLGAAFWKDPGARLASGAVLALTAGFTKELYDLSAYGEFSWRDIGWDVVGVATGLLISWLVDRFLFGTGRETSANPVAFAVVRPVFGSTALAAKAGDR